MSIDGFEIELTKKGNNINLLCFDELSDVIDRIEYLISNHKPINELPNLMSGTNILRIMDSLFHEKVYDLWKCEFVRWFDRNEVSYKKVFTNCFGFVMTSHGKINLLAKKMQEFSAEYTALTISNSKNIEIAKSIEFEIEYISYRNNVADYRINDKIISLCLINRKQLKNPSNVLNALTTIKDGLSTKNEILFKFGVSILGESASQRIIELFFKTESREFFFYLAKKIVYESREMFYPYLLIKEYFGTNKSDYYKELLGEIELLKPELNTYLVESNVEEIASNNLLWKLYEIRPSGIYKYNINFFGTSNLILEVQTYLRKKAKKHIDSGRPIASYIHGIWDLISKSINILFNEFDICLQSILHLTIFEIQELQAYLAQESGFAYRYQRLILITLRALYNFIANKENELAPSPFKRLVLPRFSEKTEPHIVPISEKSLQVLVSNIYKLPAVFRLALYIAIVTGARANSICYLTTDCLIPSCNTYYVRIYYYKTAEYRLRMGKTPYIPHEIPAWLYNEVNEYIYKTKHLRSQLDTPYIFVYKRANERLNSFRKPSVLNPDSFIFEINKLLEELQLYDENGAFVTCNFRNIRAEVGRYMFAKGATEKEVADKLGNKPITARSHYDTMYPAQEAELYNKLYISTIEPVKNLIELMQMNCFSSREKQKSSKEMYGQCDSKKECTNKNDCRSCYQRIVKK